MPELPEVETVARQLDPLVRGRLFRGLRIVDGKLSPGAGPGPGRWLVGGVRRIGKQLTVGLEGGGNGRRAHLVVHLRMTGRLLWRPGRAAGLRPPSRAAVDLEGGSLVFSDVRRFGTMSWHDNVAGLLGTAVDPLDPLLTARRLGDLMAGSVQPLKPWLLRQDRLVGIGNIYASEIPHRAGLSPLRAAGALSAEEVRRLHRSLRAVLRKAIACCGTTFSDFQDSRGLTGSYQQYLAVYGREGEPCPRCGGTVIRTVQQQRSTFHCPGCQR